MAKPIVILAPGKEREALREGGALPPSFFDPGSGISLWPRDIDYGCGPRIAETIADRPGDVPVFFGFPESENASEINERTAEIVSVLNATMVHVVFLDDPDGSGKIEYGHFASFRQLVDWGRALTKVLRARFVNEVDLHRLESVLVVVCRGQQLKTTEEEIRDFSALVGENANDAPPEALKPFVSCYFLNRELSIDAGSDDIYAASVWDILVGRLLKAFALSREGRLQGANSGTAIWKRPGIRIWKAEECFAGTAEATVARATENVLARVERGLRDSVAAGETERVLSEPCPGCPAGDVEADKGLDHRGEWSLFDPAGFAREVETSGKRGEAVRKAAESYFEWRMENGRPDEDEIHRVFADIQDDPRRLFARSREIDAALVSERSSADASGKFRALVGERVEGEKRRKGLVEALAKMAAELRLAQSHYVGAGKGLFVFAAVTAMCGVTLWQVVTLAGGSPATALALIAAAAAGALAAVVAVVATHHHAGYSATEAFVATCRDLDAAIAANHNKSREILREATETGLETHRRNLRLREHDLLARIRDVLVQELHCKPAVAMDSAARAVRDAPGFRARQRQRYLALTSGDIAASAANVRTGELEEALAASWNRAPDNSFDELWSRFCRKHDRKYAGHLPVSVFVPAMREFMAGFARAVRRRVRAEIDRACGHEMEAGLKEWCSRTEAVRLYSGKAAVDSRAAPRKRLVFVAATRDGDSLPRAAQSADSTVGSEIHASGAMLDAEGVPLALAIHEVDVELERDRESGVLALRQRGPEEAP